MHAQEGCSSHFVTLSVTFYFGEGAVFRVETYISTISGTSAVTAVIYAGTAQSLNGLAREHLAHELLVHGTLYQSCHSLSHM